MLRQLGAAHAQATAMPLDDLAADPQPQPRSPRSLRRLIGKDQLKRGEPLRLQISLFKAEAFRSRPSIMPSSRRRYPKSLTSRPTICRAGCCLCPATIAPRIASVVSMKCLTPDPMRWPSLGQTSARTSPQRARPPGQMPYSSDSARLLAETNHQRQRKLYAETGACLGFYQRRMTAVPSGLANNSVSISGTGIMPSLLKRSRKSRRTKGLPARSCWWA